MPTMAQLSNLAEKWSPLIIPRRQGEKGQGIDVVAPKKQGSLAYDCSVNHQRLEADQMGTANTSNLSDKYCWCNGSPHHRSLEELEVLVANHRLLPLELMEHLR